MDLPASREVEFRDGPRLVPEYLAAILSRVETHRYTFDEAIALANRALEADVINDAADRYIAGSLTR
jgi:hypothetical protein